LPERSLGTVVPATRVRDASEYRTRISTTTFLKRQKRESVMARVGLSVTTITYQNMKTIIIC